MPGWTGCDVCDLPLLRVRLSVYAPSPFEGAPGGFALPPGEYVLMPVASPEDREAVRPGRGGFQVVVDALEAVAREEDTRRDSQRSSRRIGKSSEQSGA
jgi:hypothetical protein